jgi:hypothetical protein
VRCADRTPQRGVPAFLFLVGRRCCAAQIFPQRPSGSSALPILVQAKQKAPTHDEKGLKKFVRSSHFPPTPAGAGFGTWR